MEINVVDERIFSNSQRGSRKAYAGVTRGLSAQQSEAIPFDAAFSVENQIEQDNREDDRNTVVRKVKKHLAENPDTYKNVQLTIEPRSEGTAIMAGDVTPTLLGPGYTLELSRSKAQDEAKQWSERVTGEQKDGIIPPRVLLI
jgi:hypothetical protein